MNDFAKRYAAWRARQQPATSSTPPSSGEERVRTTLEMQGGLKAAWVDAAVYAVSTEAAKRKQITADALHEMVDRGLLPDPGERRVFGAVFDRLKRAGKIVAVGTAKATRGDRQSGYLTVWEWRGQ